MLLTGKDFGETANPQRTKVDRKKSFAYVKAYIMKEKCTFMVGMVFLFLGMILDIALPAYIGLATNDVTSNNGNNLVPYTIIMILVIGIGSIGTGYRSALFSFFADNVSGRIRDDYFTQITQKNIGFYDVTKVGDIIGRQSDDINLISEVLANSFNVIVKSIMYSTIVLIILFILCPVLVGIFFVGLFGLTLVSGVLRRKTSDLNKQYQEEKGKLAQMSEEIFSNIRTVKAFHNETNEIKKYRESNERVILIGHRRAVYSGIFQFMSYSLLYGTLVAITYVGC